MAGSSTWQFLVEVGELAKPWWTEVDLTIKLS